MEMDLLFHVIKISKLIVILALKQITIDSLHSLILAGKCFPI